MKKSSLRHSLEIAACGLLQINPAAHAASSGTSVDSAVMYYGEADGRVSLVEPVLEVKTELKEDQFLDMLLVLDALTGASPNGAQPASTAQTFTSPSGEENYTIAAGDLPLDSTFRDTRGSITASLDSPIDRLTRSIYSASLSYETDWTSLGGSASYNRDYNNRNTTLSGGIGLTLDYISPTGGTPTPLSAMAMQLKEGNDSRTTIDLLAGVTQVINRSTLMQLNYTLGNSNGYHSDPYKVVSLIDDPTGTPTGDYYFDSRPDSRQRQSIYWKTVHHFDEDVINLAYRYYTDDWGITSHTVDLKYRYRLSDISYLRPHIRYYQQSAADFYTHSLYNSAALPEFASADSRLAEFTGTTIGLKYGYKLKRNSEFSARIEQISQQGDSSPANAIGDQVNHDLYPDLKAIILQLSYSVSW